MGWQVAITDQADTDLGNAVAFLAQKSPTAAERIGLELVELIFSLNQMPNRGAVMKKRASLRKLVHRHYLIIYRVNDAAGLVEIIRVWDSRQNPNNLQLP
jgi:plasmid stabilization system protein ParE